MDKPEWTFWPTQHIWNLLRKHIWSILTGRKKKSRQLCEVTISIWSSHCTLWIDTILILNYLPIKVSIRRVWHPSNRRRVSRVCAPALWPRYSLWRLHHWIGVQLSSHQGCPPCELLPSRKTASLSVCTLVCTHICPCPAGQTHAPLLVWASCAHSHNPLLCSVKTAAWSQSCRGYIHHGNWRTEGYTPTAASWNSLFHTLCNYCAQDAVIAELV